MDKINTEYCNYEYFGRNAENSITQPDKMPEAVSNIIENLKKVSNHDEAETILAAAVSDGSIKQMNDFMTYKCGDYVIVDMLRRSGESYAKIIKLLTEKQIGIAPEFIASFNMGSYTLLIEKIKGAGEKRLIPLNEGRNMLDLQALSAAYNDVRKLLKAGLVNQKMTLENGWFITPASKKLIIPAWEQLRPVKKGEAPNILSAVHSILFSKQNA